MSDWRKLSTSAALCLAPLVIIAVATATTVGGPCASVRGLGSGVLLFAASGIGILSVIVGFRRLRRMDTPPTAVARLVRIASYIIGVGTMLLNGAALLFAGLNLASIAYIHLYFRR